MKFLCLAYGAAEDWKALSKGEQDALLAQDEILRKRGAVMAAVESAITTVRAWDGSPDVTVGSFAQSDVPLAVFQSSKPKISTRWCGLLQALLAPARKVPSRYG